MAVTVRFWAAARTAAGESEREYGDHPSLASLLAAARADGSPALGRVLDVASFLVDGEPVGRRKHDAVLVPPGSVIEVLPPFAGG